jgi:hypothetical protein
LSRFGFATVTCLVTGALAVGPSGPVVPSTPRASPALAVGTRAVRAELEGEGSELSRRWAPLFVQHTSRAHPERDRPLRIDFDGNWDATDDWDHLGKAALAQPAVVYGSAVLTASHAFLTYTLFYPRDWATPWCVPYVCHDNDLEVLELVVDRARAFEPSGLVFVETKTHRRYLATRGDEVALDATGRPLFEVESEGHGLSSVRVDALPEGEVRVYVPPDGQLRAIPSAPAERYALFSLHETLWAHRHSRSDGGKLWAAGESGFLFYSGDRTGRLGEALGASMASSVFPGGVRPPWGLNAGGERGDWFLDPAWSERARHGAWFPESRPFETAYLLNPYLEDLAHECSAGACQPAPPAPVNLALSPVALAFFLGLGVLSRRGRRSSS